MTEDQQTRLLRTIRDLAMLGYPYQGGGPRVDERLILALGQIAGIADQALSETAQKLR